MSPERLAELRARHPTFDGEVTCGDGWFELLDRLLLELEAAGTKLEYVKQKWDAMRVGAHGGGAGVFALAHAAEIASHKVCEVCGAPGELLWTSPVQTRCKEHRGVSAERLYGAG